MRYLTPLTVIMLFLSNLFLFQPIALAENPPSAAVNTDPGPLQLGLVHSDNYGNILNAYWTNYFSPSNAFGFEVDFGDGEFRLGGTWAHALAMHQRFKISAEHLAQRPDYPFAVDDQEEWQGQNAVGAAYQYLIDNPHLKAWNFAVYTTNAEDENFPTTTFSRGQQDFQDIRHSAGANTYGAATGITLQPWSTALLDVGINYDVVRYQPRYAEAPDTQGLGASLGIEQLINDHWRVSASAGDFKPYRQYQITLAWLACTRPGTHLEIAALGARTQGDIPASADNRIGLSLAYSWGGSAGQPFTYALPDLSNAYDLAAWTAKPVVHMPSILTIKDEQITPITP